MLGVSEIEGDPDVQMFSLYLAALALLRGRQAGGGEDGGEEGRGAHPSNSMVLMMNPSVGLTSWTSSFMMHLTTVVFPALSRPLGVGLEWGVVVDGEGLGMGLGTYSMRMRSSLSRVRALRRMLSMVRVVVRCGVYEVRMVDMVFGCEC